MELLWRMWKSKPAAKPEVWKALGWGHDTHFSREFIPSTQVVREFGVKQVWEKEDLTILDNLCLGM